MYILVLCHLHWLFPFSVCDYAIEDAFRFDQVLICCSLLEKEIGCVICVFLQGLWMQSCVLDAPCQHVVIRVGVGDFFWNFSGLIWMLILYDYTDRLLSVYDSSEGTECHNLTKLDWRSKSTCLGNFQTTGGSVCDWLCSIALFYNFFSLVSCLLTFELCVKNSNLLVTIFTS